MQSKVLPHSATLILFLLVLLLVEHMLISLLQRKGYTLLACQFLARPHNEKRASHPTFNLIIQESPHIYLFA